MCWSTAAARSLSPALFRMGRADARVSACNLGGRLVSRREVGCCEGNRECLAERLRGCAWVIRGILGHSGAVAYISAEISFTGAMRDYERARRNSDYLNRITGQPAVAAIVSVRNDNEV